ncbi:MAG: prenyltransferase/squalene oxidase repeat-containing protein [Pirellulaceae bacterium]
MFDFDRLSTAYEQTKRELLAERTPTGHWEGELSSSALSTATAVSALAVVRGRGSEVRGQGSGVGGQASGRREPPDGSIATYDSAVLDDLIMRGVGYLVAQQNEDGGFGDTDLSHSNIATTMLVVAALHLAGAADEHSELLERANAYIDSEGRLAGLRERYGVDKTFVVPIMTNCAIAGLIDWREIDPLPFELATVPQSLYRFVGMPVVSYAIPALVAIGQAQYFYAPPRNPLTRLVRRLSIARSLKVLRRMQPDSGGYLEATPLTSFVVMSLASVRVQSSRFQVASSVAAEVIRHGVQFLIDSIRPDGSWPIDTNLATWNATLAINALAGAGEDVAELLGVNPVGNALRGVPDSALDVPSSAGRGASEAGVPTQSVGTSERGNILDWLLSCQHTKRHAFTGADPGGFGWSDLSGAVPDADDTAGALLAVKSCAISHFCQHPDRDLLDDPYFESLCGTSFTGLDWLLGLQNRDGGWPTFCRGWGRLPFDRSGVDLTAHAIRALIGNFGNGLIAIKHKAMRKYSVPANRGIAYMARNQHPDGSWSPLWFGNQDHPTEDNPVYGTAKVLMAYRDLELMDSPEAQRGVAWLIANQNEDGGWGSGVWERARSAELGVRNGVQSRASSPNPEPPAPSPLISSVEETALAVEALLATCPPSPQPLAPSPALARGLTWLIERVERGEHRQPAPIGFYFAKLWYYERLYPLTFTVAALGRARQQFARRQSASPPLAPPAAIGTTPWKMQL